MDKVYSIGDNKNMDEPDQKVFFGFIYSTDVEIRHIENWRLQKLSHHTIITVASLVANKWKDSVLTKTMDSKF